MVSPFKLYEYMPLYLSVPNIIDKLGSFLFNHIAGSSAFPLNFTCGVSNIAEIENSFNAYKL